MVNAFKNTIEAVSSRGELQTYMHPDYLYNHPDWVSIRDCIAGERRVKEKGETYLPSLDADEGGAYETYKSRAVYVNMVSRTVLGLVGTIFRRPLKADGIDKRDVESVTLDGMSLNLYAKKLAFEVSAVGRVGVLVDMVDSKPYLTEYLAENILSWRTKKIDGREVLVYVLLREIEDVTPILDGGLAPNKNTFYSTGGLRARYRVLLLDATGVYRQRVYTTSGDSSPSAALSAEYTEITPTRNGVPFKFIPMKIIGPMAPTADVQKSPVLDIVTLNLAHYRTSAQLEHGRYFTALPQYYVPVSSAQQETAEYRIGPSVVWEVPDGSKPGILEYYGTGLKSLTDSLIEKEEHIAQLGGRIMGIRPTASGESDNIFKLKQANEMSILLNITESLSAALTDVMKWYLDWQRKSTDSVRIRLNQDFKALQIQARELRAVALLYQQGILPLPAVFENLQAAEYLPEEWTLDEFQKMLENLDNFPNQPDVEAMHEGFPDAKAKLLDDQNRRTMAMSEAQSEMERQHQGLTEQRRAEQQSDLQDQMFEQSKRTASFEHGMAMEMERLKSQLKVKEQRVAPKAKPVPKK